MIGRLAILLATVMVVRGQQENLVDLATKVGATELVRLINTAQLTTTLTGKGPFTLFAPPNEAFARLPRPVIDELLRNKTILRDVLLYHVINGAVYEDQLKNEELVPSLFTSRSLRFNIYNDRRGKFLAVDGAPVFEPNQNATNGVLHIVGRVLFPPEGSADDLVRRDPFFATLLKAVTTANFGPTLSGQGPYTIFTPTNEAFARLPPGVLDKLLANVTALTAVLKYHVVRGTDYSDGLSNGQSLTTLEGQALHVRRQGPERVEVNNAFLEVPNISVTNGVVHVINNVLLPPRIQQQFV